MALTRLPSFTLLTTDDFTFGNVTVSGNITANYLIGNGSQLTGLPASYTDTNANAAIDAKVTKAFIDNLNVDADTLDGLNSTAFATSAQGTKADTAVQPGDLATVATTGSYTDLINKPTLFDGTYANLTGKPTLGTAAATNANAYATAAQGAKADTAIQSGANISLFTNDSGYLVAANLSGYATESYVGNAVANLVASAPAALDTLNELANALGNDASYSTTITNALANKLSTSAFTSTADTWLATKSTSNVSEGTNLYYTVARANTAIDARVTKTFVDNLSVVANIANIAYSVSGSNVVGQVGNALIAGTVYTNAQPNITSLGALTSLSVTGTLSLGDITKLYIPGGTNNYILKTDGAGNLSWAAQATSGNASIGGSNTQIFFNDAGGTTLGTSTNLTFNKITNTLSTTNFVASGTTNLGAVGNITVTGGSANNYLKTDGAGSLSWGTLPTTTVTLDAFTGNGVQTSFTLTTTPTSKDYTIAVVAGIVQPKATYSVSGTTLTFGEAPPNTAPVEVTTFNTGVSAPSSGGSGSGYTYQGVSANTTLAVATRYIVNTSSSALTLTLPTTANLGDEIGVIDGTGNASTNNITVYANGGNIMGNSGNLVISTDRAAFTLVYYNSTQGWLLTNV